MDALIDCAYCRQAVRRKTGPGRRADYCSIACRRAAEYEARRQAARFDGYVEGFKTMGEQEVRDKLANDPEFVVQLTELTETYLDPPDARTRFELDPETLALILAPDSGFHVYQSGHDTPLPSSHDIDAAAESGDWQPMVKAALDGMAWQFENGYKPDLRQWPTLSASAYGLVA